MLKHETIQHLRRAVRALQRPQAAAGAWDAVEPLSQLAQSGHAFTIDFAATAKVGMPIIIARADAAAPLDLAGLTRRQREVAALVAQGCPNKTIAAQLGISLATAKDHVHAILHRLGLPSRSALISRFTHGQT